jgi:Ni/Co efflux regulator RcnB
MKRVVAALLLSLCIGTALAQPAKKHDGKQRHMKEEERQRMREDMREVYRERQERPERPRQMSAEERDKLRRDIEETNRDLRRK